MEEKITKNNKRIAAMLTSGVLALTPCVAAVSMTSFAANKITVTTPEGASTRDYAAYQVLSGNENNGELTNIAWGKNINSTSLLDDLKADKIFGVGGENIFKDVDDASSFVEVITGFANKSAEANELAKVIGNNLQGNAVATDKTVLDVKENGYYIVKDSSTDASSVSLNLLKVVGEDVSIDAKITLPKLDKYVKNLTTGEWDEANTASIGDTVNYKLESAVPDMEGFTKYFFIMNDTLDEHLSLDSDSFAVYEGDSTTALKRDTTADLSDDDAYYYVVESGNSFKVVFKDFYNKYKNKKGTAIRVEYSATLEAGLDKISCNHNTSNGGHDNKAHLTYSNNPNEKAQGIPEVPPKYDNPEEPTTPTEPGKPAKPDEPYSPPASNTPDDPSTPDFDESKGDVVGTTPDDVVYTYVTDFVINKFYMDGTTKKALAGATFQLKGDSLKVVSSDGYAYEKSESGAYYKLVDGTFTNVSPTDDTKSKYESTTETYAQKSISGENAAPYYVDAYGISTYTDETKTSAIVTFKGLGEGIYTITEINAPDGYNKLTSPLTLTITATPDKDGAHWKYSIDSKTAIESNVTEVENKPGSTLPSTGGIGTKLFYFFGSLLFGGSAVLLVTRKRMSAKED